MRDRWKGVAAGTAVSLLSMLAGGALGTARPAGATTPAPGTLTGAGGSFLSPVVSALMKGDTAGIAPILPFYSNETLDTGISDFIGSAPGQFGADFAVTERPLTSAESATATANGRTFAYVPFAATPVAIATLVPLAQYYSGATGPGSISPNDFCQHVPLTTTQLGDIFGLDTTTPLSWGDSTRITCTGGGALYGGAPISRWANLDPTMENETLMTLLDSTPTSMALFQAGLDNATSSNMAITDKTTPLETWPYSTNTIPNGDQPLIGKLLAIDARSNAPSTDAGQWQLGAAVPISSVWTGAPLGEPWNLPTAAVQNAQGAFVAPSTAAAGLAESAATVSSSNTVTFAASTDPGAYNNLLMVEDYLVVPTNGLLAAKATALAQFIRFALGKTGQTDISGFGAAPATSAMDATGLEVAGALDVEAATSASTSSSASTTSTTAAGSNAATAAAASGAAADASGGSGSGTGSSGSGTGSSADLAFTGGDPIPLAGVGTALILAALVARRLLRRREVRS